MFIVNVGKHTWMLWLKDFQENKTKFSGIPSFFQKKQTSPWIQTNQHTDRRNCLRHNGQTKTLSALIKKQELVLMPPKNISHFGWVFVEIHRISNRKNWLQLHHVQMIHLNSYPKAHVALKEQTTKGIGSIINLISGGWWATPATGEVTNTRISSPKVHLEDIGAKIISPL